MENFSKSPRRSREEKNRKNSAKSQKLTPKKTQEQKNSQINTDIEQIYKRVKSVPSYSAKITQFLRGHEGHNLFKPVRHKFPRRRIKSYFPFQIMMSDTINYRQYGMPFNKNFKYIMVLIDVFSKKAFAAPLKTLNALDAVNGMENMLQECQTLPESIVTDKGIEYYNYQMRNLFERKNIRHYSLGGKHKASVAERFIRTLKTKLERYFWEIKKPEWVQVLPSLIENYNKTYHRSIKMAPSEVTLDNRAIVFKNLYPNTSDRIKPRLKIGDKVRILEKKNIFSKGYSRSWSLEIYTISSVNSDSKADFYKITDSAGNNLPGNRYFWELNLISPSNDSQR